MNCEEDYINTLISINKNLRKELDSTYKLLKMKLRCDNGTKNDPNIEKLKNIIEELEGVKVTMIFNIQKVNDFMSNLLFIIYYWFN